ncbi:MAG: DUF1610 domain-containing protein [Thaumarchaeota archaeon]|nr:MAG: DUF1610 domain-containing protein [Nitrososphaerota archaeon]
MVSKAPREAWQVRFRFSRHRLSVRSRGRGAFHTGEAGCVGRGKATSLPVTPGEKAVKFSCPNCHEVLIWRCQKCRKFTRRYKCSNCGFEGP